MNHSVVKNYCSYNIGELEIKNILNILNNHSST